MADESSGLPARQAPLDRQAVERVLARAAELQGGATGSDSSDLISEAQILEIGKEVGLTPAIINQALAEERTRVHVPVERGLIAQIAGGGFASATRTVSGNQRAVLAELDRWMQRQECLCVQRRFSDRITWEAQSGLIGVLRRTINFSGKRYHLVRADQVSATVLPIDESRVVVRLDADLSGTRRTKLRVGGALGGVGLFGAAAFGLPLAIANVAIPLAVPLGVLPLLLGAVAGYQTIRSHAELLASAQLALEQILDRLEHRELTRTDSLLSAFVPERLLRR